MLRLCRLMCGEPPAHRPAIIYFFEAVPHQGGGAATTFFSCGRKGEAFPHIIRRHSRFVA